jgi:hypothetical protein
VKGSRNANLYILPMTYYSMSRGVQGWHDGMNPRGSRCKPLYTTYDILIARSGGPKSDLHDVRNGSGVPKSPKLPPYMGLPGVPLTQMFLFLVL